MKYPIQMSCGVEINGSIYMSSMLLNGLLKYDLDKNKLEYITPFLQESPCYSIHGGCLLNGNEIWFMPLHGENIAIYNYKINTIDYISPIYQKEWISPVDKLKTITYSFGKIGDDKLFMLPATIDAVNIIDLHSRKIESIDNVLLEGEYFSKGIYHDGIIHAFTGDGKWRVIINPEKLTYERVPWNHNKISHIIWSDKHNTFFVSSINNNQVLLFDKNFNCIDSLRYKNEKNGYAYEILLEDDLFLLPWGKSKILNYNFITKSFKSINIDDFNSLYYVPINSNNKFLGVSLTTPHLIEADLNSKIVKSKLLNIKLLEVLKVAKETDYDLNRLIWNKTLDVFDETEMSLSDFIEYI